VEIVKVKDYLGSNHLSCSSRVKNLESAVTKEIWIIMNHGVRSQAQGALERVGRLGIWEKIQEQVNVSGK
jgi:hypothetical protein